MEGHPTGFPLLAQDTVVTFEDDANSTYPVAIPRQGHTDREVRAVAYRWACKLVSEGTWKPYGELRYVGIEAAL